MTEFDRSNVVIRNGRARRSERRLLVFWLLAQDALAILAAGLLASLIRFGELDHMVAFSDGSVRVTFAQLTLLVLPLWIGLLAFEGLYDTKRLFWGAGEFARVVRGMTLGIVGLALVTFALRLPGISRWWTIFAWAGSIALIGAGRLAFRAILRRARSRGRFIQHVLVVGWNDEAARLIRVMRSDPGSGLVPVACLASSAEQELGLDYCTDDVPCVGDARDIRGVVEDSGFHTVVIASTAFTHEVIARMVADISDLDVEVHVSSGLFEILSSRLVVRELSGIPVVTVRGINLTPWNLFVKRAFDLAVTTVIMIVGLPFVLALVALIKLESHGPVFYRQQRIGQHRRPFGMYKFRSMAVDADARLDELAADNEASGPIFKMRDDPRVTRLGRWMRKFSIDEFPQLINVLQGEMSLVGPRPPLPDETREYSDYHWRRMEAPPGMTGLWQVSGRSDLSFEDMVRLDVFYIENWSVGFDLALLARTIPAVLFARGAY